MLGDHNKQTLTQVCPYVQQQTNSQSWNYHPRNLAIPRKSPSSRCVMGNRDNDNLISLLDQKNTEVFLIILRKHRVLTLVFLVDPTAECRNFGLFCSNFQSPNTFTANF